MLESIPPSQHTRTDSLNYLIYQLFCVINLAWMYVMLLTVWWANFSWNKRNFINISRLKSVKHAISRTMCTFRIGGEGRVLPFDSQLQILGLSESVCNFLGASLDSIYDVPVSWLDLFSILIMREDLPVVVQHDNAPGAQHLGEWALGRRGHRGPPAAPLK